MKCLEITTTIGCIGCSFCPQDVLRKAYHGNTHLQRDDFERILRKLKPEIKIHFSGFSEPFLNNSCMDMIKLAHDAGHKIGLFTTLIGANVVELGRLCEIMPSPFVIQIPHAKAKHINYDKWREHWLKGLVELRFHDIHFELIKVGSEYKPELIDFILQNKIPYIDQVIVSRAGNLFRERELMGRIYCLDERHRQNVLLPNGDVYVCCNDYGLRYRLGNLLTDSVEDLYASEAYQVILSGFERETGTMCRVCNRAIPRR